MPVKIIHSESHSEPVKIELLVSTIETNRDRVRTIGNMLITTSGIVIPACLAFLLFLVDKKILDLEVTISLAIAVFLFLISLCLSIISSLLRTKFIITNEAQFVDDLLKLLHSEVRMSYYSFGFLIIGMLLMIFGVLTFVIKHWG